jgi:hypothetical protein
MRNLGFNQLRFLDKLRFLFSEFQVTPSAKELQDLNYYRNIMVHSGVFTDHKLLFDKYRDLLNLVERTFLTILGWKGKPYISKSLDYKLTNLE